MPELAGFVFLFVLKRVLFIVHVCSAGRQSQDLVHTGHVLYH